MSAREFPFVHVDVFTSAPLEGNQLAVFPDARGLSDAEMQKLAKEMNLSETTFILPRDAETEARQGVLEERQERRRRLVPVPCGRGHSGTPESNKDVPGSEDRAQMR